MTPKALAVAAALALAAAGAQAVNFNALPDTPGPVPTNFFARFSPTDLFGQYTGTLAASWAYDDVIFDFWWTGTPDPANVKFAMVSFGDVVFSDFKLFSCVVDCNTTVALTSPSMGVRTTPAGNVWFEGLSALPAGHYLFQYDVANLNTVDMDLTTTVQISAVPEPSTWALMLAGLGVMGWTARRRSGRQRVGEAAA